MDFITNAIVWIIVGGVAGWLASMIVGQSNSIVMDIVWGIVGAIIGGAVVSFFTGNSVTGLNLYSIIVATIGAVAVLSIVKAVNGSANSRDIYKS